MDNQHAQAIALQALVWILADDDRAQRLLAISGLTPDDMRASIRESWLMDAALTYLEGYEPDLIACANAIDTAPEELIRARKIIANEEYEQ